MNDSPIGLMRLSMLSVRRRLSQRRQSLAPRAPLSLYGVCSSTFSAVRNLQATPFDSEKEAEAFIQRASQTPPGLPS